MAMQLAVNMLPPLLCLPSISFVAYFYRFWLIINLIICAVRKKILIGEIISTRAFVHAVVMIDVNNELFDH